MKSNEFYCVKCRCTVKLDAEDVCVVYLKNSRRKSGKMPALRGNCRDCDCKMTKFIKEDDAKKMTTKFGKCKSKSRSRRRRSKSKSKRRRRSAH